MFLKLIKKKNELPLIMQSEMAECGLACMAMIFSFYGIKASLSLIRQQFKSTLKGLTLAQLKNIAASFNFNSSVLRININQLSSLTLPCILHWDMNHFVVLQQINEHDITLYDPARGIRKIPFNLVDKLFTGIVLELSPGDNIQPASIDQTKNSSSNIIQNIFKKYHFFFLKLILISLLIQFIYILGIKFIQGCIDTTTQLLQYKTLSILLIALLGTKIIEASVTAIRALMIACVGSMINHDIGVTVMKYLLSLPVSYFENRHLGDVISRFGAIDKIRSTITDGVIEGVVDGLISIMIIFVMCFSHFKLSLIVITFSIVYVFSRRQYHYKARQYQEEALYAKSIELSNFMETIRGIPSIKVFSKANERLSEWTAKFIVSLNTLTKLTWHKIKYDSFRDILFSIELSLTLGLACYMSSNNMLTLGALFAFLTYRQQFVKAIGSMVDKMRDYKSFKLHLDRLSDIILEPSEINNTITKCDHQNNFAINKEIILRNVTFKFCNEDIPVINNVSFIIKPKECVAITGVSGCGKTTLLKILMGLLPPSEGQLFIGDTSIYHDHVLCYRSKVSGVLQDDSLFSGTIIENISFFDTEVNVTRVFECAKLAGIIDEINAFPMKFNTLIGEMGSVLSGGQKQRVLLARALYVQPSILFLDEASSHLDTEKEIEINRSLKSLGITVVMIAHRKETITMADRVISLSKIGMQSGRGYS